MSESPVRYVVAWGGDKRSKDALALGATLARTFAAELAVIYVVREEPFGAHTIGDRSYTEEVVRQAREAITRQLAALTGLGEVVVHVRRSESVARGVLDVVDEIDAGLVVIGAGARRGALAASPIVSALLHASPVPVAMAPRGYRKHAPPALGELVAAVGPRTGAGRILDEAISGVERTNLPLRLVSLLELDAEAEASAERAEAVRRALGAAADQLRGSSDVTTQIGKGKNVREAVRNIEWNPASALVIGSSRLAQGKQTFIGTLASRMLAELPVPMIVAPRGDDTRQ